LKIFAHGSSTVGTGAESKVYGRNLPITIQGVRIEPVGMPTFVRSGLTNTQGDIVFCDPIEGIVVIPKDLLDETLTLMPKLVVADDKVMDAVSKGMPVAEAFSRFRC
jgi:regulator of RNase E activity RraA